jgi:hypothetical protein
MPSGSSHRLLSVMRVLLFCVQVIQLIIYSRAVPISILSKPIKRMLLSSISARYCTIWRHRCGAKKGMIPSITIIKQTAIANSCHMLTLFPQKATLALTKKPGGKPGFINLTTANTIP